MARRKIYYTTDGSTAVGILEFVFESNCRWRRRETINAIAIDPSLQNSNVSTAAYVIQAEDRRSTSAAASHPPPG